MKLTKKQLDQLLETFQNIYNRGGAASAEIEYLLMIMFNQNTYIVNKILEKWDEEE